MAARRLRRAARDTERRGLQELSRTGRIRLRRGLSLALSVGSIALVAASCSSRASGPTTTSTFLPVPSSSTTTTVPTSTTTPTSATDAAVLTAYRAAWAAYDQASKTANPFDPTLPATMINPILEQVKKGLVSDEVGGIVAVGSSTHAPRIYALSATESTVLDCAFSRSFLVYKATGKQVPPITKPEHDGIRATLTLVGSTWKVSQQTVMEGKCPAGY
jgi:hypothetical protein